MCCFTIRSDVDTRIGTFMPTLYEACRAKVISHLEDSDHKVDSTMDAVRGQLLRLLGSVDAVHVRIRFPPVTDPTKSDLGAADPLSSSGSASFTSVNVFFSLFPFFLLTEKDFLSLHDFSPNSNRWPLPVGVN